MEAPRRSARLANRKIKANTEVNLDMFHHKPGRVSSRRSGVGSLNMIDISTKNASNADSRKIQPNSERDMQRSRRTENADSRRIKPNTLVDRKGSKCGQLQGDAEMKRVNEIIMKKQQKILDMQQEILQLTHNIHKSSIVGSSSFDQKEQERESWVVGSRARSQVSKGPNIKEWVSGNSAWSIGSNDAHEENIQSEYNLNNSMNHESCLGTNQILRHPSQCDVNMSKFFIRLGISTDLPVYFGDPIEWPNFINQYQTSTNICGFSKVENQLRLQKCLKGQARKAVQSMLIMPHNVDKVISFLEQRFGRPELIIGALIDKIRNYPHIRDDKLNTLIDFSDEVGNLIATIEALQDDDHLRNPLLLQELLNKLPTSMKLSWIQYISDRRIMTSKLVEFNCWLKKRANAAAQLLSHKSLTDRFQSHNSKSKRHDDTFTISEAKRYCICCQKEMHHLSKCPKFKSYTNKEKWSFVTEKKICFSCLLPFHGIKTCRKKKFCKINGCKKLHNSILHNDVDSNQVQIVEPVIDQSSTETTCHISNNRKVLLKILPVTVSKGMKSVNTFALLDDASTVTLIEKDLADELDLSGPRQPLSLRWTNNQAEEQPESMIVSVKISGAMEANASYYLRHARTMQGLDLPNQIIECGILSELYPYIDRKIITFTEGKPRILIGQDNWPLMVSQKIITGPWNGPAATKTPLGWTIHGVCRTKEENQSLSEHIHYVCFSDHKQKDDLDVLSDMVRDLWKIEFFPDTKKGLSREDIRAEQLLRETMHRVGNRFETGLLWKTDHVQLPESKTVAIKRLRCTERKMDKDRKFAEMYTAKIEDMERKGYISKLSGENEEPGNGKLWYLPHFGVINPNKPGKLRIVFDAASKSNGVCLNDFLLAGPDLYKSLQSILFNFRIKKFAFTADIKEMFLQVAVKKEDRVAQRILYRGMERNREPDVYEINVVFFGSSSGPCLAQEAKNMNAREYETKFPQATNAILQDHYMDDYLGGADIEEEARKLIQDVIYVHNQAGFMICNWISNHETVFKNVNKDLLAESQKSFADKVSESSSEKILGVWWDPKEDCFSFKTKFHKIDSALLENKRKPTKRDILKTVMSVFDPIGFLGHFIIHAKILLQHIWRSKINWDDEIPDSLMLQWQNWLDDLKNICQFKVPRQYVSLNRHESTIELHIFCDASENAYATVAYLRWQKKDEIRVSFVSSKTRVAPLKPLSIPRLELQAALLGARLGSHLKENLNLDIKKCFYWTDSKTVLHWIQSEARRFKMFVAHRLGEIQELTNVFEWNYVPSKVNPADEATKRNGKIDFSLNSKWMKGPEFLTMSSNTWHFMRKTEEFDSDQTEIKKDFAFVHNVNNMICSTVETPDPNHFSRWEYLLRSTAWMYRFIQLICKKVPTSSELDATEISKAEIILLRRCQRDSFAKEVEILAKNENLQKNSQLYTLDPVLDLDDGLLKFNGRLQNAPLDINCSKPIILHPKHAITKLIIKYHHEMVNHHGQETVVNTLRQKFWIIRARQAVRSCWANCQKCKNRKASQEVPIMGQLPLSRLEPTIRPFIRTGIDYFGPIEVSVKRSREKRYGVIFTCLTTRAVHLEIAQDLSTNGFIHVLRQFGCRRGFPEEIYSDNGTNFKGCERELKENLQGLNQSEIMKYCSLRQIQWFFNPPLASHMGGVWERLIQSIKKNIHEVLKFKNPPEYVLRTILIEIENILNCRPLTHVSIDPSDPEPLTPNHFLIGPSYAALPCALTDEKDINLLSKWKAAQRLVDVFWQRWKKEYIPTLIKRNKWHVERENIKIGDVVLISDHNLPRNCWPMGRVVQLFPGNDGKVRVVDVETSKGLVLRRPVSRLCILDVRRDMISD